MEYTGPEGRKWKYLEKEFKKFARKYPNVDATRNKDQKGGWTIWGPTVAVYAFCDLAEEAAKALGFHGTRALAVNFFLDHMNGDHHIQKSWEQMYPERDTEAIVIDQDGNRQGYFGRQKI